MKYWLIISALSFSLASYGQPISAPSGLTASWDSQKREIALQWDTIDQNIAGYHLFVKTPNQKRHYLWTKSGLIFNTNTSYTSIDSYGGMYSFKVAGFRNFPERIFGETSEVVVVSVPSTSLPLVSNIEIERKKKETNISWEYPTTISDLAGFILIINQEEIRVDKTARDYQVKNLPKGSYSLSIASYNTLELRSDLSTKKLFVVK